MNKKFTCRCAMFLGLVVLSLGCLAVGRKARAADVDISVEKNEAVIFTATGKMVPFTSLDQAVSEVGKYPGCTVKVWKDNVNRKSPLKLSGSNYTLDLNGHVLARYRANYEDRGEVITIKTGADVKIVDSKPDAAHFFYKDPGGLITAGSSKNSAGGIHIEKNANLTMTGGTIADCRSKYEGAGLRNENGRVCLNGVTIKANICEDNGGGIIHMGGFMVLTDCVIEGNLSKKSGGGMMIKGENVEFHDCTIKNNQAIDDGGGITVRQDKVYIDGGYMTGNYAKHGGGIYVDSYRDINIQGRLIIDGNKGGGNVNENLYLQDGMASSARVYDGGLLPGSRVLIVKSGTSDASYKAVIGATKYEFENGFIAVDEGRAWFSEESRQKEVFMATAVDRYGWGILVFIVLELIGIVYIFRLTQIRKRYKTEEKNSEDIN